MLSEDIGRLADHLQWAADKGVQFDRGYVDRMLREFGLRAAAMERSVVGVAARITPDAMPSVGGNVVSLDQARRAGRSR